MGQNEHRKGGRGAFRRSASRALTARGAQPEDGRVGRKNSPETLRSILKHIETVPNVSAACRAHGIVYTTLRYWNQRSFEGKSGDGYDVEYNGVVARFHVHFAACLDSGVQQVEDEMVKRALGYEEVLTHHGHVIYRVDEDLVRLGFTGPDAYLRDEKGHPIPETVTKQSEEMMLAIVKAYRRDRWSTHVSVDVNKRVQTTLVVGPKKSAPELEAAYGGKQEIQDVEFVEVEDDPSA